MIVEVSDLLARWRRGVLVGAAVLSGGLALTTSGTAVLIVAGVVGVFGMAMPDLRALRRRDVFEVSAGRFATRAGGAQVLVGVAHLGLLGGCFAAGVGDRHVAAWLALLLAFAVPLPFYAYGLWHGRRVVLTRDGVRAVTNSGAVVVPWAALDLEQPGQEQRGAVALRFARPELITVVGCPVDRDIVFTDRTGGDLVAAAIQRYVTDPQARAAIGEAAEYERLRAAPAPSGPPRKPRTRRDVLAGILILVGAAVVGGWTTYVLDDSGRLLQTLPEFLWLYAVFGIGLMLGSVPGTPPDTPEPPAPPSRPAWARDVTGLSSAAQVRRGRRS